MVMGVKNCREDNNDEKETRSARVREDCFIAVAGTVVQKVQSFDQSGVSTLE